MIYYLSLFFVVLGYAALLFGSTLIFFTVGGEVTRVHQVTYILLAVLLVFTFQPLRNFFEKLTNHLFFRDRYDAQALIARLGDIYSSNYKLVPISTKTLLEIYKTIKIERGNIIVFDQDYKEYFRANQNFMKPGKLEFRASSDTIQDFQQLFGTDTYVYDELLEGKKKFFMQHHGISLIFPLINNKKLNGYLLISSKRSGDIYNSLDVSTLSIISNDLAIALDNALSVAKIEDFNATLQHRVKSATEKLRTANKNLRALDKAKDEFLSMASHQLKTPITTIRGYSDLFITGELGKATPDQTMAARRIMTTVGNMDSTINDLLNVSRISQDRFFIQREEVDLKELIELELENLISTIEDKGLKLMTDLDPIPTQDLDKAKIRQAVMNLIDNAIYYTQEGSIKVILKLLSRSELKAIIKDQDISSTPDFSGDPEDRLYPVFQVTDTGIGVPPDKQSKLFSKFYRADNAQRTRSDGTGLGIYLVKRVVEDHGGGIFFSSPINNNKGSTFGWWVR
ncbi:GAF domain-containing sensor histidine kinase [Candidatus Saccharibacteria bacterium]|nr:GAF domain-containing sensor histidine kinase [Candidatus Saccharibacteria bacterium]